MRYASILVAFQHGVCRKLEDMRLIARLCEPIFVSRGGFGARFGPASRPNPRVIGDDLCPALGGIGRYNKAATATHRFTPRRGVGDHNRTTDRQRLSYGVPK